MQTPSNPTGVIQLLRTPVTCAKPSSVPSIYVSFPRFPHSEVLQFTVQTFKNISTRNSGDLQSTLLNMCLPYREIIETYRLDQNNKNCKQNPIPSVPELFQFWPVLSRSQDFPPPLTQFLAFLLCSLCLCNKFSLDC